MATITKSLAYLLLTTYLLAGCNKLSSSDVSFKSECPTVEMQGSDSAADGILVLSGPGVFLMNLRTMSITQIDMPEESLYGFAVSPNRVWVAYSLAVLDENLTYLKNDLVVAGADSQIANISPWESNWSSVNWLDNSRLIISLLLDDESQYQMVTELNFLLLNPFTGERHTLKAGYPEMYNDHPLPNWDGWRITAYNADADRVVYLQGRSPFYYTLWDTQHQEVLAQFQVFGEFQAVPRWTSDGTKLAVAPSLSSKGGYEYPSYEVYSVSWDGDVTQLTHLSDYYRWVYISDLSWSPNNQYIAFWYSYWNDTDSQPYFTDPSDRYLGVLDVKNGETIVYCIHGELNREIGTRVYRPPLWSPDSRQVVIQSQVGEDYLNFQTILVDIHENRAYHIADNLEPVGWMVSP